MTKTLIQRLWLQGIGWDDLLSKNIQEEWFKFIQELPLLSSVKIPRFILSNDYQELFLHGFCDASNNAFAAIVYVRLVYGITSVQDQTQQTVPHEVSFPVSHFVTPCGGQPQIGFIWINNIGLSKTILKYL